MQISEIEKPLFKFRTSIVLSLSIIADVLDFVGGPILGIPPIGDIPNAIITGILYALTGSKKSARHKLDQIYTIHRRFHSGLHTV